MVSYWTAGTFASILLTSDNRDIGYDLVSRQALRFPTSLVITLCKTVDNKISFFRSFPRNGRKSCKCRHLFTYQLLRSVYFSFTSFTISSFSYCYSWLRTFTNHLACQSTLSSSIILFFSQDNSIAVETTLSRIGGLCTFPKKMALNFIFQ